MRDSADLMTQELLVQLLAEAPDDYLGADAICGKLGLPRAVVFRQIDRLRLKGYRIDNRPARGYRLLEVPDRLTSLEITPLLTSDELGCRVHAFDEVDSTNDVARGLAEDGAAHGELVVAEAQRHGRGRRGRAWLSEPKTSLTFSLVLRPDLPLARAPELTLTVGVALCEVLRDGNFPAQLKWPNDVLINGRKVAGILTEAAEVGHGLSYAVIGVGVNVNAVAMPAALGETATSLRLERGEPLPRALLLTGILAALERWLQKLAIDGPTEMLARSRDWSATLGRRVTVDGPPAVEGIAEAIDDSGALLVNDGRTVHRVVAGDVAIK
jgi:BirA family transcriptional regulator, biotin operon repressor / biotin---[acetyl-CoA-carboxylase] ligase